MSTESFFVGDREFEYTRMKPFAALGIHPLIMELVVPLFAGGKPDSVADWDAKIASTIKGLKTLPQLAEVFEAQCRVKDIGTTKGWVQLKPFRDQAFGSPLDTLDWLAQCIRIEFGDFLAETGLARLTQIMTALLPSSSPSGLAGQSGG